mmetsp:Transcript_7099/g.17199  ORF Transcript_7099/g.17199 Transcript_7099/m.17199 type:complete len:207 (-) Transcript_7099:1309-1929(-)
MSASITNAKYRQPPTNRSSRELGQFLLSRYEALHAVCPHHLIDRSLALPNRADFLRNFTVDPGQELRCNHASVFVRKQCMVSHAALHGAAAQRGQIISRRELAHHLLPQLVLAHRSSLLLQLVGRSHPLPFRLHFCELFLTCYSSVLEPLLLVDRHGLHLLLFLNLHYCLLNGLRNQNLRKEVEFIFGPESVASREKYLIPPKRMQ